MSKTIIINRSLTESEIHEVKQLAEAGAEVFALSGNNIPDFARQISFTPDEKKQINYQMMDEVIRFGDLPVGDQTLADLFRIDTASVWHYHKFRVYFTVCNLMYFLKPIQNKFSSFPGHIWFVSPETKLLQGLFSEVDFRFQSEKKKGKINFGNIFSYILLVKYRCFKQLFPAKMNPEYLLYLNERYSTVLDLKTRKPQQGNTLLEYLIDRLDNRFALLTELTMPKIRGKSDYSYSVKQFQSEWYQSPKIFTEGFLISGLFKSGVRKETYRAHQSLKQAYSQVRIAEQSFDQQLIFEIFKSFDKSTKLFLYRYFAARHYFKDLGVKAVIAGDENSPLTKSILDAARFCGIKIIGLQHGTMHDLHPAYLYTPRDRENRVMPDLTLTWGKYWEEFLIRKGNYPKDSVVSVGQIRTDIIPFLLTAEKQKMAKPTDLIVFASQPQRDPELRYQAAFDVFKAAKQLPKSKLIVKLHPREYDDSDYYSAIANEAGCSNYMLDTTSDLYQLIASCDVLITCFSTVGTETVYFYKPLIILDHLKQDIAGYAAEGVAFQATNADTLTTILSGILRGTLKIDRRKYDSFIQKYAFQIDGRVAERCIEAITTSAKDSADNI